MGKAVFTFHVDEQLKEQFIAAAKEHDSSVDQLLCDFMHDFITAPRSDAEYDAWFRREVKAGLDDANAGNLLTDEEAEAEFAPIREAARRKLAGI